jgi:hypothetical protein
MKVAFATVHCTDTTDGLSVSLERILEDHTKRGFGGYGYHLLIQPSGEKNVLRGLNEVAAHVSGHNTGNIGIALAGSKKFTPQQFESLSTFLDDLRRLFEWKPYTLFCHYEWDTAQKQGKTCPNIDAKRLLAWYLTNDYKFIEPYLLKKG